MFFQQPRIVQRDPGFICVLGVLFVGHSQQAMDFSAWEKILSADSQRLQWQGSRLRAGVCRCVGNVKKRGEVAKRIHGGRKIRSLRGRGSGHGFHKAFSLVENRTDVLLSVPKSTQGNSFVKRLQLLLSP